MAKIAQLSRRKQRADDCLQFLKFAASVHHHSRHYDRKLRRNGCEVESHRIVEGIGYTQWYIDGIEYRTEGATTNIEAIYNETGRYVYTDRANGGYEYTLRDHLGNARVTFIASANKGLTITNNA